MVRRCAVEGCLSDSLRLEDTGVTFHKVPVHSDIRPKWLSLCRIPQSKKTCKVIYICSRHFLRADFCNFKGKKYMLRQGVLPSVFPWDKSKLDAIKVKPPEKSPIKEEVVTGDDTDVKSEIKEELVDDTVEVKSEVAEPEGIKQEPKEEKGAKRKPNSSTGPMSFAINSRIEALDFNNTWYPARVVEEDYEENEVLIHFEKYSSKYDEWICMDSPRLRPLQSEASSSDSNSQVEKFVVGERCLASWSDARKFPAHVTKVLANDTYQVLFDDGFVKNLKSHRMCKSEGKAMQSSPLFDPIQSTKQERRDKKRKINVAALFGKRSRHDLSDERIKSPPASTSGHQPTLRVSPTEEVLEPWVPQWENGIPVGIKSTIDVSDGTKPSIIVPDPRLPPGWSKHLSQRIHGMSAGKWDTFILSPDNKRFRSKSEVKNYLDETKLMKYNWSMFDFSIHRQRTRKKEPGAETSRRGVEGPRRDARVETSRREPKLDSPKYQDFVPTEGPSVETIEEENPNYLKIPIVEDGYQCPIEGCGKTYRRENLAQMHVKHYHPEYTKFLDSTPNVADLAYARTVGESLDSSPGVKAPTTKPPQKTSTPKPPPKLPPPSSPQIEAEPKPQSPSIFKKDSEIIKLLNTKPFDVRKDGGDLPEPPPPTAPPSTYSEFRLKELLNKSEGIPPPRDNMNPSGSMRPSTGIKTLLPVVRPENKSQSDSEMIGNKLKANLRRKHHRGFVETFDSPKGNETDVDPFTPVEPPPIAEPNNIIVEGGQVIKIVRMKQEEIINCTCNYPEEDGLMIQCDLCLCWQHAFCNNIERESQVPEKYVCYICQNPLRQRTSKKYLHDQDWLKLGTLATTSFHTKDEEAAGRRFEKLKKSHDLSGGLLEVRDYLSTLRVKLKIAEAKNHPKLYLWSKAWEKTPLPEKVKGEIKPEAVDDPMRTEEYKSDQQTDSMLMMILKGAKDDVKAELDEELPTLRPPIIPQPEAAIDSADCRVNLLEHIAHSQSLVEERLDEFERQIDALEDSSGQEDDENYPRTRQTLNMLLRDLNTLHELSQTTTL